MNKCSCALCSTLCDSPHFLWAGSRSHIWYWDSESSVPATGGHCRCVLPHSSFMEGPGHQLRPQVWQVPCSLSHFPSPEASVLVSACFLSQTSFGDKVSLCSRGWTSAERATCLPPQGWHHAWLKAVLADETIIVFVKIKILDHRTTSTMCLQNVRRYASRGNTMSSFIKRSHATAILCTISHSLHTLHSMARF